METKLERALNFLYSFDGRLSDLNITDYIDEDDLHEGFDFDDLRNVLDDKNAFNVEIIYYSRAMEILTHNDSSLNISLGLASDMGYSLDTVNSEVLASLLASEMCREEFEHLEDEINEGLEEIWNS